MRRNPIKKGLKVQIEFNIGSKRKNFDTYILQTDYDRLVLSFPDSQREYAPYLREGSEIKIFIYTFNGVVIVDSCVYDSPFDGAFTVEFNEQHQIIQRRKYLRMPFITDFFIQLDDGNLKRTTVDIGGGGIRFLSTTELSVDKEYKVQLRLNPNEHLLKAQGVIHKKSFYKPNEYVLEFTTISENEREKIIQKCLLLDRELNQTII